MFQDTITRNSEQGLVGSNGFIGQSEMRIVNDAHKQTYTAMLDAFWGTYTDAELDVIYDATNAVDDSNAELTYKEF